MSAESSLSMINTPPPADWFLQRLVNLVNQSDTTMGITVQVGGMFVSGTLVGGAEYFSGFADDFAGGYSGETANIDGLKDSIKSFGDIYKNTHDDDSDPPPTDYIHLKNAVFLTADGRRLPTDKKVWWRGRLSEVGGFFLGSLSVA